MNNTIVCSWSGGKDSCFALMQVMKKGYRPGVLLNVLNEQGKISRSHGIPAMILERQAAEAGIPLHLLSSSWNDYESLFTAALKELKERFDLSAAVFGDIDLQPHRDWEEKVCAAAGLETLLPLWQKNRKELVLQMLQSGIETMIVSCNEIMGERFIGKQISASLIEELEALGIDACGENGEFHTLVTNCPLFANKLDVQVNAVLSHNNYYFSELALH